MHVTKHIVMPQNNLDFPVDIRVGEGPWETRIPQFEALVHSALKATASATRTGACDVLLSDDDEIRALNRAWRGKDKPTDVLSFPADMPQIPGEDPFLGDIAISLTTMVSDAEAMNKPVEAHFFHLLVHGYLHLLGHDHQNDDDAEQMEALEIAILDSHGYANPYVERAETE